MLLFAHCSTLVCHLLKRLKYLCCNHWIFENNEQAALAGAVLFPLKTRHEKSNEGTHGAHTETEVFEESDVLNSLNFQFD